jgi:5,10-methylene-tetrahydrofolate dehydrogenase/methenyl tetrahydrofolate cyclohydrolase
VRAAKKVGMKSRVMHLPENTREFEIVSLIRSLNKEAGVHGILVQVGYFSPSSPF